MDDLDIENKKREIYSIYSNSPEEFFMIQYSDCNGLSYEKIMNEINKKSQQNAGKPDFFKRLFNKFKR